MALGWLGTIATFVILFLLTSAVTAAIEALVANDLRRVKGGESPLSERASHRPLPPFLP